MTTDVGAVLSATFKGKQYQCRVVDGGYDVDGTVASSLSAAARLVTGTSTNGRKFWNVGDAPAPPVRTAAPVERRGTSAEGADDFEDDGATSGRCITCGRRVASFPPPERQLPQASARYPQCAECLRIAWQRSRGRFGKIPAWVGAVDEEPGAAETEEEVS